MLVVWKILFIELGRSSKWWHISLDNTTDNICYYHHWFYQKSYLSEKNLSNSTGGSKFPTILNFTWKFNFYYWQETTVSCFSQSNRLTFLSFKKCLPNTSPQTIVYHLLFPVKMIYHEESIWFNSSVSDTCAFPGGNHLTLVCSWTALCILLFSSQVTRRSKVKI